MTLLQTRHNPIYQTLLTVSDQGAVVMSHNAEVPADEVCMQMKYINNSMSYLPEGSMANSKDFSNNAYPEPN